jgi:hypothetical protein
VVGTGVDVDPYLYEGQDTIPSGSSGIKKVEIEVRQNSTTGPLRGAVTLQKGEGHFSGTDIRPHCWIKMVSKNGLYAQY